MKHKKDAIENAERLIDLHNKVSGVSKEQATKSALITAEEAHGRNDSLSQRTINYIRELVYGVETANLLHDKESELRRVRGHRGFEFEESDNTDELSDAAYQKEYDRQKAEYHDKISKLEEEIENLKK